MEEYKRQFIDFMVESKVLKFGEFTLKSGRKSPFFMNAGAYVTGSQLKRLCEFYARAIHDNFGLDFDVLFGPAYKGIPLAVSCAIAFHDLYGKEVRYCSNRKEVGKGGKVSAQEEIQERYGFPVASIVTMAEVVEALNGTVITPELKAAIDEYYEKYGVK